MAYTHVAHDCCVGSNLVIANDATLGGPRGTRGLGDSRRLAGGHQFCKIGAYAFIANSAIVTRDVPPYVMAAGNPAEPHSINSEGLKRRGFTDDQVRNIRNAYRVLYRSDLLLADAVAKLTELGQTQPEVKIFVEFIGKSERSLVR